MMIDLNAQIRSMASKSSFDKTLLAGTQTSRVKRLVWYPAGTYF